jgi:omega-6 fatty acid desaturase (delta-12 desaturase)
VGWILHSALLVPYHSWRITHSRHHKATNHLSRDQVFVPSTKQELVDANPELKKRLESEGFDEHHDSLLEASPLMNLVGIVFMLTLGWPAYLIYNVSGQKYPSSGWASHFFPSAPFFEARDYWNVLLSVRAFETLSRLVSDEL